MPEYKFDLMRGAYQDNGASPWYSTVPVGSQKQMMKLALDTGTNMDWVTSTQCNTTACTMPDRVRFDPAQSNSFAWVNQDQVKLDYGPWGKLTANTGRDQITLPDGTTAPVTLGLAIDYHGEKFIEVDWDGCIALPSIGPMQDNMSFLFEDMVNSGQIDQSAAHFGFCTDVSSGTGCCILGGYDTTQMDLSSVLYIPYALYNVPTKNGLVPLPYIWSSSLAQVLFDGVEICQNATFCLDTGSSRFKGDGTFMNKIRALAAKSAGDLQITVGQDMTGQAGQIVVPPSIYEETIEKGTGSGTISAQFHELDGVTGLFLAGSILMDHLYTVHQYRVIPEPMTGGVKLIPLGMFITNRPGGPRVIQNKIGNTSDMKTLLADNLKRAEQEATV